MVDSANGVGASKLQKLAHDLPNLHLDLRNAGSGPLNSRCGADFVQKGDAGAPCLPTEFKDVPQEAR